MDSSNKIMLIILNSFVFSWNIFILITSHVYTEVCKTTIEKIILSTIYLIDNIRKEHYSCKNRLNSCTSTFFFKFGILTLILLTYIHAKLINNHNFSYFLIPRVIIRTNLLSHLELKLYGNLRKRNSHPHVKCMINIPLLRR